MSIPYNVARRFCRRHCLPYPVSELALDKALEAEEIGVIDAPADFPAREFRRGRVIGVRVDQSDCWRLWLKAHALGHFLMHRGDQVHDDDGVRVQRQERQADLFAGWLLIGGAWSEKAAWEVAEERGLPVECVERWLAEVRASREMMLGW